MMPLLRRLFARTATPSAPQVTIVDEAAIAAAAVSADRKRANAILSSPAAVWRESLARGLAFETDLSAEAAIDILRSAPTGRPRAAADSLARCGREITDDPEMAQAQFVARNETRPAR